MYMCVRSEDTHVSLLFYKYFYKFMWSEVIKQDCLFDMALINKTVKTTTTHNQKDKRKLC